jgi:hypothetical protein
MPFYYGMATLQNKSKSARGKTPREVTTIASDVFSEAEAAAYLHQKPRTIREWRARRGLPCFKPTAKVTLYRRADLDAWLDRTRVAFPPKSRARSVAPATPPPRRKCKAAAVPGNESAVQA